MAKKKQEIKIFNASIDAESWDKKQEKKQSDYERLLKKAKNRYDRPQLPHTDSNDMSHWLYEKFKKISQNLAKGNLPEKFEVHIELPLEIGEFDFSGEMPKCRYGYDRKQKTWADGIKKRFGEVDRVKFVGSDDGNQTRSVSVKVDVQDDKVLLIAKYKLRGKRDIVQRKVLATFEPQLPTIRSARTEINYKGDLSAPENQIKVEALIRVANKYDRFTNYKYIVDVEKRTLVERKSGDLVQFHNQEEFFDHLIKQIQKG